MAFYFKFKKKTGFTLIELLVVIALLGIIASIVLAALDNARDNGKNAATGSDLISLRNEAELYFSDHSYSYGSAGIEIKELPDGTLIHSDQYGGSSVYGDLSNPPADLCSDPHIQILLKEIANGSDGVIFCAVSDDGGSYRVYVPLSNPQQAFCVDSHGFADVKTEIALPQIEFRTDTPALSCN